MQFIKESEFYSVVLLGSFNPLIYHPFWLKEKNLINQEDINVKELSVNSGLSQFKVGEWMEIIVRTNRAEFRVRDASKIVLLRDLVLGCLSILKEDPIVAFGVNRGEIVNLENKKDFYAFGAKLHPLSQWKDSFSEPRLQSIVIEDNQSAILSCKTIIIQTAKIKDKPYCVDFNMNYHYDMPADKQNALDAMSMIQENMQKCLEDYADVVENIKKITL